MTRRMVVVVPFLSLVALVVAPTTAGAVSAESKVTVGSPTTPYLPNGSNEPALAMDANHPERSGRRGQRLGRQRALPGEQL